MPQRTLSKPKSIVRKTAGSGRGSQLNNRISNGASHMNCFENGTAASIPLIFKRGDTVPNNPDLPVLFY
jgi:hypothetical protein